MPPQQAATGFNTTLLRAGVFSNIPSALFGMAYKKFKTDAFFGIEPGIKIFLIFMDRKLIINNRG